MQKYFYHLGINPTMESPDLIYGVFDRTSSILDLPQIEQYSPIGRVIEPLPVPILCAKRAHEIVRAAGSRYINVAWSGGIDSTLVLAEILKAAPKEQVQVLMNEWSIKEYPDFYASHIQENLKEIHFSFYDDNGIREAIKDGVVVTGLLFDQTFGSSSYRVLHKDFLDQEIYKFLDGLNIPSREAYLKLMTACPRKLKKVKDFLWWFKYTLDYQNEEFLWLTETEELILDKNIFHFGGGQDWNDFAVSTPAEVKWPGYDFRNYKQLLKDQLLTFTHDREYTRDKVKVNSWRRFRTQLERIKQKAIYIDTNWKRGWSINKE